jgi:hypothetical protein
MRLKKSLAILDADSFVYAELRRYEDGKLETDSERTATYSTSFDPFQNSEFVEEVMGRFDNRNTTHETRYWFDPDGIPEWAESTPAPVMRFISRWFPGGGNGERGEREGRWMYLSYRWTPAHHEGVSYLMVTGISRFTLDVHVPCHAYVVLSVGLFWLGAIAYRMYRGTNKLILVRMRSSYAARYEERGDSDVV